MSLCQLAAGLSFFDNSTTLEAAAETRLLESANLAGANIHLPVNAKLGIEFDFGSNFGALMYNPPTIGSSQSPLWSDTPPAPFPIGNQVGNIGFELATVPEPTGVALAALAIIGLLVVRLRSRRVRGAT